MSLYLALQCVCGGGGAANTLNQNPPIYPLIISLNQQSHPITLQSFQKCKPSFSNMMLL